MRLNTQNCREDSDPEKLGDVTATDTGVMIFVAY